MPHIAIISSSIRIGRNSHRVAIYFEKYIIANDLGTVEILDLKEYNFPLFDERFKFQKNPSKKMLDFADKVKSSDGILIVTPEYNGGYPASLKNAIDFLYDEWHHKPIAISMVSEGAFGGSQVITSLQFSLWKMHASTVSAMFPVAKVREVFDENGNPMEKSITDKRSSNFIAELLWQIKANSAIKNS